VRSVTLGLLLALAFSSACTERFSPSSRYLDCMEGAGYELGEASFGFSDATGDLIVEVAIEDPPPGQQSAEMLEQSDDCILQVNDGVTVTTMPTSIPEGPQGVFIECVTDAGYEVFDVQIAEDEVLGLVVNGFGSPGQVPEDVVAHCEEQMRR
jgi:hypothetical protein